MKRIYLDPGHGLAPHRPDVGAVGPSGKREAEWAYRTAVMLASELLGLGHEVRLSRESDEDPTQTTRADRANRWNADLFVSCHYNGWGPSAHGAEVLHWHATSVSLGPAEALLVAILDTLGPLGVRSRGLKPVPVHGRGATVLRDTRMPAVLIEPLFITHPAEEQLLTLGTVAALARSIAATISDADRRGSWTSGV